MKNLLKKILLKVLGPSFFIDLIDINKLQLRINNTIMKDLNSKVVMGITSAFYPEAEVFNLQNNNNSIVIGENTHIRGELLLFKFGGNINIGSNCYIGKNTIIRSGDNISIGNSVLIAHNCNIIDCNSHEIDYLERDISFKKMVTFGHPKTKGNVLTSPILIKDNVWVSYNVSILKGVTIGKGAIIAAGSVVTKDVPAWTMVAGNPAVKIKEIN